MGGKSKKKKAKNSGRSRRVGAGKFSDADLRARSIGERVRGVVSIAHPFKKVRYLKGMRKDVLVRFLLEGEARLRSAADINRIFRAAHGQQDELFSTALTREFVEGIFARRGINTLQPGEREYLQEMIDLASSVRIPTEYSGFATRDAVMQHPANRARALFEDPYRTASLHSRMDTERRDYVQRAMERALDANRNATEVMQEGVKAAIEYTLNYFTAAITADNVHPFTRSRARPVTDTELQNQLASRERMKIRYQELSGDLRALSSPETQQQSWVRQWGVGRTAQGEALVAPPSPRRQPTVASSDIEMMELVL